MGPRRGEHREALGGVVEAVQRPEHLGVVQPMAPVVEEGIDHEQQDHLQGQGLAGDIGRVAGGVRQPGLGRLAGDQHHAEAGEGHGDGHQGRQAHGEAGHVRPDRSRAADQQIARRARLPAHAQVFDQEHRGQDQGRDQGVVDHPRVQMVHGEGVAEHPEGEGVGRNVGQRPATGAQGRRVGADRGEQARISHAFQDGIERSRARPSAQPNLVLQIDH